MESNGKGVLRSVNVGQARELELRGKPHKTGIFKEPVSGRVKLSGNSVEGDVQADRRFHGGPYKAVYSYTVEDYAWWEQELGRPLPPATFGENLTIEGISAVDALIGERWAVGSAVLAVTQPRQPCWKLAAKMGEPYFVRRFKNAGRAGAYLAIVQEGDVGAGDTVEVVSRPSHPDQRRHDRLLEQHRPRVGPPVHGAHPGRTDPRGVGRGPGRPESAAKIPLERGGAFP